MNKKIRNLIIGGIVLVVLVGVLLLLLFLPQGSGDGTESSSTTSYSSTTVQLFSREKDEITSLEIKNEAGGFTITREAEDLYTIEALEGFEQTTSSYSSLVGNFASVSATHLVEEAPTDIAKYGLEAPATEVIITYSDDTENHLYVGDTLPTGEGRYVMVNDDPAVYTLGSTASASLENSVLDYVDTTVIAAWVAPTDEDDSSTVTKTSPDIKRIYITGGSLTEKIGDTPLIIEMGEYNSDLADYGMSGSTWRITSPVSADLHSENTTAIRDGVTNGVTATSIAAINPTEEQLTEFGFDEPYARVEFTRDNDDFAMTIGANADGNSHYVMLDGRENVVYVVADESLPWISVDLDKVFSSLLILPYIDSVSEVEVQLDGETYLFESEGEDDDLTATVNGQPLTLDNYRKMYQYLLSAPAEEINYDNATGTEIARITYRYRESDREDYIAFLQVTDRRCVLSLNGDEAFITRMAYIERLRTNIEKILNDELPDLDY